eukprot:354001-Chlamydomonas_euryale.AAC.11
MKSKHACRVPLPALPVSRLHMDAGAGRAECGSGMFTPGRAPAAPAGAAAASPTASPAARQRWVGDRWDARFMVWTSLAPSEVHTLAGCGGGQRGDARFMIGISAALPPGSRATHTKRRFAEHDCDHASTHQA